MPIDVQSLPLWALGLVFAAAAGAVWTAGFKLTRYVDAISTRTGIGKAFAGMLLLGGITSLPEVAAVGTSAATGNAPLAINNLLGTASINILLLAVADIVYGRDALTSVAAKPATLMQGVLSMLLAAAVAFIATVGDVAIWGVGVGAAGLAIGCAAALRIASRFESRHVWEAVREEDGEEGGLSSAEAQPGEAQWPLRKLAAATAAVAAVILFAGYLLSTSADGISRQTGLAAGMAGFLLVGLATSLPEVSSITAAVRLRRYDMAAGDVFGTNIFNIALIFLADLFYRGGPVMDEAGQFETVGAILAMLMTGIFIVGLLERRDRALFRMGYDSLAGLILFAGGVTALAQLA